MNPLLTSDIQDRAKLIAFLGLPRLDFEKNGKQWENPDLPRFLDALQGWLQGCDGYYTNQRIPAQDQNPWRVIADALTAARIYE